MKASAVPTATPFDSRASARFDEVKRPLALFVRGLLGYEVPLHLAPAGSTRAFANEQGWFLPASFTMFGASSRKAYYAAAAHFAAHARFGQGRFARSSLKPIQWVLVSLFEDARVERELVRELPGLRRLFVSMHVARPSEPTTFPALCARLARALADSAYVDAHPLIVKARAWFDAAGDGLDSRSCRTWGSLLGNDVGQLRLPFNAKEYVVEPGYRDDHRLLWDEPEHAAGQLLEGSDSFGVAPDPEGSQERLDAGADRESPSARARFEGARVGASPSACEEPSTTRAFCYPEYDYLLGQSRPGFCTVWEQRVAAGAVESGASSPPRLTVAATRVARKLRAEAFSRRRRELDGDELDLDAAISARSEMQLSIAPDPRIFARMTRTRTPAAALLLLDLSQSTAAHVPTTGQTLLALERDACLLFGEMLDRVGDRFAVHGFSSNGRERVEYHRFKELEDPWNGEVKARFSSLAPRLSTRMGAALRHATHSLRAALEPTRILILLTDGEPADVDAPDPGLPYLLLDARRAVVEARRAGVYVFAINLDPEGARYGARIFGPENHHVLHRPERLPQLLGSVYARLVV